MKKFLLLFLFALPALAGYASGPEPVAPYRIGQTGGPQKTIFICDHGLHTGLIVEAAELNAAIPELAARFPGKKHYEIGWGDSEYYRANEPGSGLALHALFLSDSAALHVVAFNDDPERYFSTSDPRRLAILDRNHETLVRYLKASLTPDSAGRAQSLGEGLYGDSEFYAAAGEYGLTNTCNRWTAKALCSAGFDITHRFKITASSVMDALPDDKN